MLSPFSSIHRLHSGFRMFAPRATAIACKCIELITALCLFCVCFLCTHWSHCVVPFCSFLLHNLHSVHLLSNLGSSLFKGRSASVASFHSASALSTTLAHVWTVASIVMTTTLTAPNKNITSFYKKHQKTKLYRAAHRPFISVGLKLLDGLEWTMDVEIGTKQHIIYMFFSGSIFELYPNLSSKACCVRSCP